MLSVAEKKERLESILERVRRNRIVLDEKRGIGISQSLAPVEMETAEPVESTAPLDVSETEPLSMGHVERSSEESLPASGIAAVLEPEEPTAEEMLEPEERPAADIEPAVSAEDVSPEPEGMPETESVMVEPEPEAADLDAGPLETPLSDRGETEIVATDPEVPIVEPEETLAPEPTRAVTEPPDVRSGPEIAPGTQSIPMAQPHAASAAPVSVPSSIPTTSQESQPQVDAGSVSEAPITTRQVAPEPIVDGDVVAVSGRVHIDDWTLEAVFERAWLLGSNKI